MQKTTRKESGFTLIELLVVIAIIGILASIILASLNTARTKSRDARRVADMNQLRNAVELYNDDNKHYPDSNAKWASSDSPTYSPNPIIIPAAANFKAALQPYMSAVPVDPRNLGTDSGYLYIGAGSDYCILIYRTPENMNNFSPSIKNPARPIPPGQNSIYMGTGLYSAGC